MTLKKGRGKLLHFVIWHRDIQYLFTDVSDENFSFLCGATSQLRTRFLDHTQLGTYIRWNSSGRVIS
jgi:hypothetical protein